MSAEKTEFRPRDRWLMFGLVLGPLASLSHLTVTYMLVPSSCASGSKTMLHVSTLVFLLLAAAAALIGWSIYKRFAEHDGVLWKERTRWLANVTIWLAVSSIVVIVAMEIPNWILRSCD